METFQKKKDAINFLRKCNNKNFKFFQEDNSCTNNSKKFIVTTYDKIYNLILKGRNNLYESWTDKTPLYFAVDIDYKIKDKKEEEILKNILCAIIDTAKKEYNHTYNLKDFYITKTDNQKEKLSFHITCKGLVFENYIGSKTFYEKIKENYPLEGVDDSIYRLTCLRMTNCTKKGKKCELKPYTLKLNKQSSGENSINKIFWYNTLITNINSDDKFIKNKKIKKQKEEIIINEKSSNVQLEVLLSKLPKEYCDNYTKWVSVGLACYNDNPKNYEIFDKWSSKSVKYNKDKNKKIWDKFNSSANKKEISIGSIIYWLKENNINLTDIFPSIKYIVENYPKKPIHISENYKITKINKDKLEIKDIEIGLKKRLFCIQSEKGTGKTTSLIKKIFESDTEPPESILFISSRRTFGIKLLSDLKKFGFQLYSDIEEQFISLKRVIIQINSLQRLCNIDYDLIIIDECESLARYLTSSHFMKNNNSGIITSDLEYRIKNSEKTIIMDADLSDRCINYYKEIIDIDNKSLKILINEKTPYDKYTINYTKYENWVSLILKYVEDNKKLVIPMASNNKAKDLKNYILSRYPNKNVCLIHKETNDKEKLERLLNVNTDWTKFDIVIYTPTVCMGVSFDVKDYFDNIFAYGCHESLGSQEFCQMMHRVREPKDKNIYIAIDKYNFYDITDDNITYEMTEEMICSDYYLTKYDIHTNLIPKKFGKDRVLVYPYKDDVLYDLYIRNSMERITDTNNFTANFFGYIKYKKYKIKYLKYKDDENCSQDLKEIKKERIEKELLELVENIIKADNLSKKEYKEKIMRKDEFMDDETLFAIKKYNLKDCYDIDNFNDLTENFIKKYHDKGLMLNYNNLKTILNHTEQCTNDKIKILKQNEKYTIEYLGIYEEFKHKNKFTYHYYPFILLKYIGYNINNIDSNVILDEELLQKNIKKKIENVNLCQFLEKEKNSLLFKYNLRKTNINYSDLTNIINFVNKILNKQYGIKIIKEKKKYYLSTNKLWNDIDREEKIIVKKIKSNIRTENNENKNITKDLDEFLD